MALAVKTPAASASPGACRAARRWAVVGSFEFVREAARKPFLIYDHTYSNGIRVGTKEPQRHRAIWPRPKWARVREVTEENKLAAGAELFQHQSELPLSAAVNDIEAWAAKPGMSSLLEPWTRSTRPCRRSSAIRPKQRPWPPPVTEVGWTDPSSSQPSPSALQDTEIPAWCRTRPATNIVLLAWPDQGLNMVEESQGLFSLRAPSWP